MGISNRNIVSGLPIPFAETKGISAISKALPIEYSERDTDYGEKANLVQDAGKITLYLLGQALTIMDEHRQDLVAVKIAAAIDDLQIELEKLNGVRSQSRYTSFC